MSEDEIEVIIEPNSFKIQGKIPDKVIYLLIAVLAAALGVSYEEIFNTMGI